MRFAGGTSRKVGRADSDMAGVCPIPACLERKSVADPVVTPVITIEPVRDFDSLGERWRQLERDSDARFFKSWTFLGCQAATRFAGASLLAVTLDGQDAALALLGRQGRKTYLNETGMPAADAVFIEHNGLLVRNGCAHVTIPALRHLLRHFPQATLSGIDDATLAAARSAGAVHLAITRRAPTIDLAVLNQPLLETLSSNARAQIRRALRHYPTPPTLQRAATIPEAHSWFDSLVTLHQATWTSRGKPGAFADPAIRAFHHDLIARGTPTHQTDMLRIAAGETTIGYLYSFVSGTRAMSYQSGFAYTADPKAKPGLVCHTLAADHYRALGLACYDFLGGADRYKLTLANGGEDLHWIRLFRRSSILGVGITIKESTSFLRKRSKKLLRV